jgi:hypothetical protein
LRDEDIHHTEEVMLQINQLSVEEVAQRRGELRKMRELMVNMTSFLLHGSGFIGALYHTTSPR